MFLLMHCSHPASAETAVIKAHKQAQHIGHITNALRGDLRLLSFQLKCAHRGTLMLVANISLFWCSPI